MTGIEELLARALLVRERTVPRDVVPYPAPPAIGARPVHTPDQDSQPSAAEQDLHALCETVVLHTPPSAVAKFVSDQLPEPRSALVLACVLQLTDTGEGARFWWQYAAGAGQAAAAYCLYLHHMALGERDTADWWHQQADEVQPPPEPRNVDDGSSWNPAEHRLTSASTTEFMRILRLLAKQTVRSRPAAVSRLMAYIPTAVTAGYLREPDSELPLPGKEFARRITTLLAAGDRLHTWHRTPNESVADSRGPSSSESVERAYVQKVPQQLGTAGR
ncbi:hypothetical protein [Streptomyces sp. NPDC059215]|uniref:hypothetical protein n=1 Tax=Streptomyces sp. NPDC059215 TaxID=3346772 RepID=UPI0036BEEB4E